MPQSVELRAYNATDREYDSSEQNHSKFKMRTIYIDVKNSQVQRKLQTALCTEQIEGLQFTTLSGSFDSTV